VGAYGGVVVGWLARLVLAAVHAKCSLSNKHVDASLELAGIGAALRCAATLGAVCSM
jgi:hypothetical protein